MLKYHQEVFLMNVSSTNSGTLDTSLKEDWNTSRIKSQAIEGDSSFMSSRSFNSSFSSFREGPFVHAENIEKVIVNLSFKGCSHEFVLELISFCKQN